MTVLVSGPTCSYLVRISNFERNSPENRKKMFRYV